MRALPYFDDLLDNNGSPEKYRSVLESGSAYITRLLKLGDEAIGYCFKEAEKRSLRYDNTILALARRFVANLDGVNSLLNSGCAETCFPLLRAILETSLGITHITEDRHAERAMAYSLAAIRRKVQEYRRVDISTPAGQRLHQELSDDIYMPAILRRIPSGLAARADELERRLNADPDIVPILAEWNRLKNGHPRKNDPKWYSLFGGANDVRTLAKKLKRLSLYEFLYKEWSDSVHAGDALTIYRPAKAEVMLVELGWP